MNEAIGGMVGRLIFMVWNWSIHWGPLSLVSYIFRVREIRIIVIRGGRGRVNSQTIRTSDDAFKLLASKARGLDREHFWAIHLTAQSTPIAFETVSIGTSSASLVHPREVFRAAIVSGAAAIVLAHNHPSGDMSASAEDLEATRRLVRSGELLGIPVMDHLILDSQSAYSSLKQSRPELFEVGGRT